MVNHPRLTPLRETVELFWIPACVLLSESDRTVVMFNLGAICDTFSSLPVWDVGEIVAVLFIIRNQGT